MRQDCETRSNFRFPRDETAIGSVKPVQQGRYFGIVRTINEFVTKSQNEREESG